MWIYIFIFMTLCMNIGSTLHYMSNKGIRDLYKQLHPGQLYTLEHVVPKSIINNNNYTRDMHNILWVPSLINNHRDNYKFVNIFDVNDPIIFLDYFGNKIKNGEGLNDDLSHMYLKSNLRREIIPIQSMQGKIARSCLYFIDTYPEYQNIICEKVIDLELANEWHYENPPTKFEIVKNKQILKHQGNLNLFIENPKLYI